MNVLFDCTFPHSFPSPGFEVKSLGRPVELLWATTSSDSACNGTLVCHAMMAEIFLPSQGNSPSGTNRIKEPQKSLFLVLHRPGRSSRAKLVFNLQVRGRRYCRAALEPAGPSAESSKCPTVRLRQTGGVGVGSKRLAHEWLPQLSVTVADAQPRLVALRLLPPALTVAFSARFG